MDKYTPQEIKKKLNALKSDRGTWEEHWQDVADYVFTRKNTITTTKYPGERRAFRLLDNTGMQANEVLAGALHGMLTNPDMMWFELSTGVLELDNQDNVRTWLQNCARAMHFVLNNSNFQTEVHELYLDLCAFGTGCMFIQENDAKIVRFRTKFIRDYYICENYLGVVDEIYYSYKATAKDIVAEFGMDSVHKDVKKAYEKDDPKKFTCVHAVYPKSLKDPKKKKGFISQYVILDLDHELSTGSFNEFPYVVPRWTKAAGEIYGRSPGMNALPELKVLNKMNETMLIGAQKLVDPPLQMPDDGFIMPIITTPGGLNYYRSGTQELIRPIFNDTRIDFGYQAMEDRRKRVRDSYYIDHLRLQQGGPMMTATEVLQRTEEAMRLLGPMLGRQQVEFLNPLVDRVFNICVRRNMFPLPPAELQGMELSVKYSSLIAKAQRVNEAQSIIRAFSAAAPFIQLDPGVAQIFNGEKAIRTIVSTYGAPQEMLRTEDEVASMRAQQEQAQMAAQAQAMQSQQSVDALNTAKAAQVVQEIG
jgi:hypothetical protein